MAPEMMRVVSSRQSRQSSLSDTINLQLGAISARMAENGTLSWSEEVVDCVSALADAILAELCQVADRRLDVDNQQVWNYYDAQGGSAVQMLPLYEDSVLSAGISAMPAGMRTITSLGVNRTTLNTVLMGKLVRKEIVARPSNLRKPVELYSQDWNCSCTQPAGEVIRDETNSQLYCVNTNELRMRRPTLSSSGTMFSLKSEEASVFLTLEARGPYAATRYFWSTDNRQPPGMAGAPARGREACSGAEVDRFRDMLRSCVQYQTPGTQGILKASYLSNIYRIALRDAWAARCFELDAAMRARRPSARDKHTSKLLPRDMSNVLRIGDALMAYAFNEGRLDCSNTLEVVKNDEAVVMWRYHFFESELLSIRLHLFPCAAETYIHNHRSNLISMSLYGTYTHVTWEPRQTKEDRDDSYFKRGRNRDGCLQDRVQCSGSLEPCTTFVHYPQHTFYLDALTYHTVSVSKDAGQMLTLFVKDKLKGEEVPTYVLETGQSQDSSVERSSIAEMTGFCKEQKLREIESLLQESFNELLNSQ